MNSSSLALDPNHNLRATLPPPALTRDAAKFVTKAAENVGGVLAVSTGLSSVAIGYWFVFWCMNGLDKFLNRSDLGLFAWYGKDRIPQFTEYFSRMGVPSDYIDPVLHFAGLWELIVCMPFLGGLILAFASPSVPLFKTLLATGFVLSGLTLIAFSGFDVIAGDRAELREHGLYLILLIVSCVVAVPTHSDAKKWEVAPR
ncbi:MAG: hypothetical protein GY948_06855 [Alphaproteobacteria bacterium]|nr:hypothetical protein [Alphaproteobacteria bacterium]